MNAITAADILRDARTCDWTSIALAFNVLNNQGDGWDPEGEHLGTEVAAQDGLTVYDDAGDAVIVGDAHGAWAVRVWSGEPITIGAAQ